ncbi:MAG: hypothetical protein AAF790_09490 [Planctomycetota bacterium]
MLPADVSQIIAALPAGRSLFYDFPDRYALRMLRYLTADGAAVADIKRSRLAGLLRRPAVKSVLASCGDGRLRHALLESVWREPSSAYRLTLGRWPNDASKWDQSWHQMARPGQNLVLQLNFPRSDHRRISRLAPAYELEPGSTHPVADPPELTLAWARLDIDLPRGEALIEELQSDWSRETQAADSDRATAEDRRVLRRHARGWQEVMLHAAVWFCVEELGLSTVFLYDAATGARFKGFQPRWQSRPPVSLYTDLPRRFGLQRTAAGPLFLRDTRSRRIRRAFTDPATRWWVAECRPDKPRSRAGR